MDLAEHSGFIKLILLRKLQIKLNHNILYQIKHWFLVRGENQSTGAENL